MLKSRTAYPITDTNAHILGLISGFGRQTLEANPGWYATFSESRIPRWQIVPKQIALEEMEFEVDTESYP